MPPTATVPKLIDAGATEIAAAPEVGALCEPDAGLGAVVNPVQPEMERIAKSKRSRAAAEIAFKSTKRACGVFFSAPSNNWPNLEFVIAAIVVCGPGGDYCPDGHLTYRGGNLHLPHAFGGKRRSAPGLLRASRRIGFGRIPPQSKGRSLRLRSNKRFPRRWNQRK